MAKLTNELSSFFRARVISRLKDTRAVKPSTCICTLLLVQREIRHRFPGYVAPAAGSLTLEYSYSNALERSTLHDPLGNPTLIEKSNQYRQSPMAILMHTFSRVLSRCNAPPLISTCSNFHSSGIDLARGLSPVLLVEVYGLWFKYSSDDFFHSRIPSRKKPRYTDWLPLVWFSEFCASLY